MRGPLALLPVGSTALPAACRGEFLKRASTVTTTLLTPGRKSDPGCATKRTFVCGERRIPTTL